MKLVTKKVKHDDGTVGKVMTLRMEDMESVWVETPFGTVNVHALMDENLITIYPIDSEKVVHIHKSKAVKVEFQGW